MIITVNQIAGPRATPGTSAKTMIYSAGKRRD